jgi:DNA-binding Xre family transcriptional regulator
MLLASARWQVRVTQRMVTRGTGLNSTPVNRLINNTTSLISLPAIAVICAYFGCSPGDVLSFTTDGLAHVVPSSIIRRPQPPMAQVAPVPLRNTVPDHLHHHLEPATFQRVADQTGLSKSTIHRLAQTDTMWFNLASLATICIFLRVPLNDLFVVPAWDRHDAKE